APSLNRGGTFLAFTSTATFGTPAQPGHPHVFVRDLGAGTTALASVSSGGTDDCGTGGCYTNATPRLNGARVLSDDGTRVVFYAIGGVGPAGTKPQGRPDAP